MVINFDKQKELILRLKQGERSAFDELVEIYKMKGFAIAFNMVGNVEDAKDILQETFIKIYTNIKYFQEKSQFSTWFYRIVVNCSLDFLRKRKRISHIFVESIIDEEGKEKEPEVPDTSYEPARIAMRNELSGKLEESIAKLPEKQRISFVLKHQNGLSTQEISKIIKCNPQTVKVHLFRAVNNLRKSLSKYYI